MSYGDVMWLDEIATFGTKRWDGGHWGKYVDMSDEVLAAMPEPELARFLDRWCKDLADEVRREAAEDGVPERYVKPAVTMRREPIPGIAATRFYFEGTHPALEWFESQDEWMRANPPAVPAERARKPAEPRWGVVGHEELGTFVDGPDGVTGEAKAIVAAWAWADAHGVLERPQVARVG